MQILPISNSYYQLSTKIWVMNQKAKEYRNKALEDSKGTVYESLIKSQN